MQPLQNKISLHPGLDTNGHLHCQLVNLISTSEDTMRQSSNKKKTANDVVPAVIVYIIYFKCMIFVYILPQTEYYVVVSYK